MRENITNTPINSGLGDNLKVAFDKVNSNFIEVYDLLSSLGVLPTKTSDLTNDGENGINPFITLLDIPTSYEISDIDGLQTALDSLQLSIVNLQSEYTSLGIIVNDLTYDLSVTNALIVAQNSLIVSQNLSITAINNEIIDIKQRLDILEE